MVSFKHYYDNLNSGQKAAVDNLKGPLLVLAGPGTGKTELLSVRAANILHLGQAVPENILILTYTNAASKAMKERLVRILGPRGYDIQTDTFHGFANSILSDSEEAVSYVQERIQITDIEKVKTLEYILDHTDGIDPIRPFRAPYTYRSAIEKKISELKQEGITPKELAGYISSLKHDGVYVEEKHIPRIKSLAVVYKLYEEYKSGKNKDILDERGRYDFDDMIIFAIEALGKEAQLRESLRRQYAFVMVDEFQDANGAQLELLFKLLSPDNPNLCCVGDDDQSIYRFQGASVGNFKLLKSRFSALNTISLKDNYRSTQNIISISDMIIKGLPDKERIAPKALIPNKDYADKRIEFHEFTTEAEELLFIEAKVKQLKAVIESSREMPEEDKAHPYNNIAILVRRRKDILKITDTFLRAGIPYATDGKEDTTPEKRVRQLLDVISLADTRNTVALSGKDTLLYKVLTSDYFEIVFSDILEFIRYFRQTRPKDVTLFQEFLSRFELDDIDMPVSRKTVEKLPVCKEIEFKDPYRLLKAAWAIKRLLKGIYTRPVHAALLQYIDDAQIYKYILKKYEEDNLLRIRDLRALTSFINMIKESDVSNPAMSLADFIDEIETRKEHSMPLQGSLVTMSQDGVRVFTAHGSKGLEFHTVIIPFCLQDKNWPVRPKPDLIPLPPGIFKTKERVDTKDKIKELNLYDETRLFYVASTRAKANLLYTASPLSGSVSSLYISRAGLKNAQIESPSDEEVLLVKSVAITEKKDPFAGTDSVLKDMVSGLTLNPTSLNNYINCKRKFLYTDVLRLPSRKRLGLTFGNCVHKALEDVYRFFIKKGGFPDFEFFKSSFLNELGYQGVEKSIYISCGRQVNNLRSWFMRESVDPIKPLGLEKKIAVMITDDLLFTGKYDKTEAIDPGRAHIRVVDYKTGKPDGHIKAIASKTREFASSECDEYLRQLVAYKLLFDRDKSRNKRGTVKEGLLVFVEPVAVSVPKYGLKKGEFINKLVDITDKDVDELVGVIKEKWSAIKSLDFAKLPEYDNSVRRCGGCDYKNICWE